MTDRILWIVHGALVSLRRAADAAVWFLKGIVGESKYASYRAHALAAHPGEHPLSEREYWRLVYRDQDANPGSRCC